MRRLNDKNRDSYAENASLESIQAALKAEHVERRRVDRRITWLEDLLLRRAQQVAAGAWPGTPAAEEPTVPATEMRPQRRDHEESTA
ncbi:hypothetical protein ACGFR8_07665 [Streptomyces brevispora]|uniref:hypothetical protein n=1 Tax=Streptomyces brevispora TaxID=887462 RepID=UPI0037225096